VSLPKAVTQNESARNRVEVLYIMLMSEVFSKSKSGLLLTRRFAKSTAKADGRSRIYSGDAKYAKQ
jgi:hypothetical protein